ATRASRMAQPRDYGETRPNTTTPSRRGLLAGTAAILVTGGAATAAALASPADADAELIRLVRELKEHWEAALAIEAEELPPGRTPESNDQEWRLEELDELWGETFG